MTAKLYRVTCRGMHYGAGSIVAWGIGYVVATTADEAYQRMRAFLDQQDIGFTHDRGLDKIELMATEATYDVGCPYVLYLPKVD